jgi:hypothetical protein
MSVQRAPLARSFKAAPVASVISPLASASRSSNQHAVEPKVHASHKMVPGHAPRRIEIERKKRLFASLNIEVCCFYTLEYLWFLGCSTSGLFVSGFAA